MLSPFAPSLGNLGFALVDLSFVSALLATIGFAFHFHKPTLGTTQPWERMAKAAYWVHVVSILGVFALLLGMIFTRQYSYQYVWSHSSNELSPHFMLACLWEGQEGSFLIWMVWHALLSAIVFFKAGPLWRSGVLAVVCSVQAILGSMILGANLPIGVVYALVTGLLVALAWLAIRPLGSFAGLNGAYKVMTAFVALLGFGMLFTDRTGLWSTGADPLWYAPKTYVAVWGLLLLWLAYKKQLNFLSFASALALSALVVWGLGGMEIGPWKIGSSPFRLLRDAFPDSPIFTENPDFIPTNGTGLNPLLQNYWMVIHPPTLFLGFAATLIPFAYGLAALWRGDYTTWAKPAQPWAIFSAMILGVGIIMGGYWAYETLNFGGYWNWDPVENASFVPWLTAVGGVHALLNWQSGKASLRTGLMLLMASFVLVLYSTFLTRSGILGNTSVHSFTDLGLSGQLLVLLLAYTVVMLSLMVYRWNQLPASPKQPSLLTRQGLLFLGAVVLTFAAGVISLATSIPVFNKILGTNIAPPTEIGFFYYKWNVWMGILIAALSGVGQYFFWLKMEKVARSKAIFRPFILALVSTVLVMGAITYFDWEFAFDPRLQSGLDRLSNAGWFTTAITYLGYAFLYVADELLLAAGIFAFLANLDVLIRLLRKHRSHIVRAGGAIAHAGFAMMLIGILFSSGYSDIVSVNLNPSELEGQFTADRQQDNVQLVLNMPRYVKGYQVTYRGRNSPLEPFTDFEIVTREEGFIKLAFRDADNERYTVTLPERQFLNRQAVTESDGQYPIDLDKVTHFIQTEWQVLDPSPQLLNSRSIFAIEFVSLSDSTQRFTVYPETEMNGEEGITPHPDRRINLLEDIYVHISGIPTERHINPVLNEARISLQARDTISLPGGYQIVADSLVQVGGLSQQLGSLAVRAKMRVLHNGREYRANPLLVIDSTEVLPSPVVVSGLGLEISFVGVVMREGPDYGKLVINVGREEDFVTFQAIRKPYINFLWLGTFLLTIGFGLAIYRRVNIKKYG